MSEANKRPESSSDLIDGYPPFLERIVRLAAAYESCNSLQFIIVRDSGQHKGYWAGPGNQDGKLTVSVNCNDLFYWATADLEPIETDDDLKLLESCLKICSEYGPTIYACRKRKMRPQNCVLAKMPDEIKPHLESCGPPRSNAECG